MTVESVEHRTPIADLHTEVLEDDIDGPSDVNGHPIPETVACNATSCYQVAAARKARSFAELGSDVQMFVNAIVYIDLHSLSIDLHSLRLCLKIFEKHEQFAFLSTSSFEFRHKLCHVLTTEWQAF